MIYSLVNQCPANIRTRQHLKVASCDLFLLLISNYLEYLNSLMDNEVEYITIIAQVSAQRRIAYLKKNVVPLHGGIIFLILKQEYEV